MEKKNFTAKFSSILEAEILSESQMELLDGGEASCQQSCKKSCQPGNQNSNVGNGNKVDLEVGEGMKVTTSETSASAASLCSTEISKI